MRKVVAKNISLRFELLERQEYIEYRFDNTSSVYFSIILGVNLPSFSVSSEADDILLNNMDLLEASPCVYHPGYLLQINNFAIAVRQVIDKLCTILFSITAPLSS